MGVLDGILGNKCCGICGKPVNILNNQKLTDGNCCKECMEKLSSWYVQKRKPALSEIKYQIECRNQNRIKVQNFEVTRIIGNGTKVYFDEKKLQFIVSNAKDYKFGNPDVLAFSDVVSCVIDIKETKKEMKYKDNTGESKSFNPPCYACLYDFYIEIDVKIPYINSIRFKINDKPIDNGQELCINLQRGGLLGNLLDAVMPAQSNNGKTSNADEVRNCTEYKKCEEIANEIRDILLYRYKNAMNETKETLKRVICPWCDSAIDIDGNGFCDHCGGKIEISMHTDVNQYGKREKNVGEYFNNNAATSNKTNAKVELDKQDTLAYIAFVFGIMSIFFLCCCAGWMFGLVGLAAGIIALDRKQKKSFCIVGITLSSAAIIVSLIIGILSMIQQ